MNGTNAITQTYNSLGWQAASSSTQQAARWSAGIGGAGTFSSGASGAVVYTAADGATWTFPSATSTTFTAPAGFLRKLVASATTNPTYTMTDPATGQVIKSDTNGQPVSVADKNGNTITITNTSGVPTSIVSTAGTAAAKTASGAYSSTTRTYTLTQGSGSTARTVKWIKDTSGNLTSYVDGAGKTTTFAYSGTDLTGITSPTGATTTISYSGTTHKVSQVVQSNTTSGAAGASTTRLSYASSTSTLVAGPNTDTTSAVSAVPHITYALNATQKLVNSVTDAAGRVRSKTYNANYAPTSATIGSGSTPTASATYGANSGQSLTKVASAGGASQQLGYNATPAATAYLPATTTDDAGNVTNLTYDGVGNQLTSSSGSGATAATATLTYTAGQVATATAPGNGTNKTTYSYTNKQLTGITPVTFTPTTGSAALGARAYTYDAFGRIQSASDGAGRSTTYTYDGDDRVLTTSFSDSTPTVTNTYDTAGHLLTQASGSGTLTNTVDQLGNVLATSNTANGTVTYTYDKAGNQTSVTGPDGTATSAYDDSGVLTSTTTPSTSSSGTQEFHFITDANGRRTDTYTDANADNSTWASRTHTDYDSSGRITETQGWVGPSATDNSHIYDLQYCYNTTSAAPTCGTTTTNDRSNVQWVTDNLTGQTTTYTYDDRNRVTKTVTAGSGSATAGTWDFTYDVRGNRTGSKFTTAGGTVTTNQTLTYNAANQISTTGYAYDGAGNLIAAPEYTFTYNGAEQMTTAVHNGSQTTTYTYAGADQKSLLSLSTAGGDTRTYMYGRADQNGNPTLVTSTRNGQRSNIINDSKTGQPIALATPSYVTGLYAYDGTGNPFALLVDDAAAFSHSFDPYGTETVTHDGGGDGLPANPFTFKAGIQDIATGLVKFGQRWYNPYIGAWTQQDTLDSPLDPANGNRYAYAASDPINGYDPTGQLTSTQIGCGLAFVGVATIFGVLAGAVVGGLVASVAVAGVTGQLTGVATGVAGVFACA
ncbi:RHS repeat domain-containing protein [Curtobacterium sp. YR515]|uniref:RHS repeat domain-containing protein n=1 Tax=Curtobacterium sp. YR515 TaxID=1855316 RepID=UPI000B84F299|nr:RHS repeat-associated core domain-containing protein [Curtobacterium sp. YR515]